MTCGWAQTTNLPVLRVYELVNRDAMGSRDWWTRVGPILSPPGSCLCTRMSKKQGKVIGTERGQTPRTKRSGLTFVRHFPFRLHVLFYGMLFLSSADHREQRVYTQTIHAMIAGRGVGGHGGRRTFRQGITGVQGILMH